MTTKQGFYQLLKNAITNAKKHPKIALFLPTALGAAFQLFELLSIGFSYIRFFSTSQIIADGILCCMILFFLILISFVFSSYLEKVEHWKARNTAIGWKKNTYDILITILASSVIVPLLVVSFLLFSGFDWKSILFFGLTLFVAILIVIPGLYFLDKFMKEIILKKINYTPPDQIIYNLILPLFGFIFLVALFFVSRPVFRLSDNLQNTRFIYNIMDENYPDNKNKTIIYNNDKYIFVEVIDNKNKKMIESFEFKELFERP